MILFLKNISYNYKSLFLSFHPHFFELFVSTPISKNLILIFIDSESEKSVTSKFVKKESKKSSELSPGSSFYNWRQEAYINSKVR